MFDHQRVSIYSFCFSYAGSFIAQKTCVTAWCLARTLIFDQIIVREDHPNIIKLYESFEDLRRGDWKSVLEQNFEKTKPTKFLGSRQQKAAAGEAAITLWYLT